MTICYLSIEITREFRFSYITTYINTVRAIENYNTLSKRLVNLVYRIGARSMEIVYVANFHLNC